MEQLRKDARKTYTYLEMKTGINHLTITKYLKILEDNGIIIGYSPEICVEKIQNLYLILFKSQTIDEEVIKEFILDTKKMSERVPDLRLIDFYSTLGEYQIVFVVGCNSINDLNSFIEHAKKSINGLGEYLLLNGLSTKMRGTHINKIGKT